MTGPIDIPAALGLPPLPSTSPDAIGTLVWAREVLQKHITTNYAVTDPKGIEELKPIKVGGIDQWLHIRGRNRNNPVLLYIHGGPGFSLLGWVDAIQRPWEDYFTVVHWDQRQVGKSHFSEDDENAPVSVEQHVEDAEEVIEYLRDYLNKDKLFVLGHSWGSVLGMHLVKRHPEWLYAYIGLGQVVGIAANERGMWERLMTHAKNNNDHELVSKLEEMTLFPESKSSEREKSFLENGEFIRQRLNPLGEASKRHVSSNDEILSAIALDRAISPHFTSTDLINFTTWKEAAVSRPPYTFLKNFLKIDLPNDVGSSFDVPIFFFSGAHDYVTPVPVSDEWFSEINSPHKELIHFEESCHYIINEEPGKFLNALVNKVLPFAEAENNG